MLFKIYTTYKEITNEPISQKPFTNLTKTLGLR